MSTEQSGADDSLLGRLEPPGWDPERLRPGDREEVARIRQECAAIIREFHQSRQ